jgi:DNA-3-methyladenine glycosylase
MSSAEVRRPARGAVRSVPVTDAWFARDTLQVARDLIGARLAFGEAAARIVEVEAYKGDPASHFVTRPRTAAMMGTTFGRLYIYRIYGVHRCVNVTTERDAPGAVLLRALEPLAGIEAMRRRRGGVRRDTDLASGPARLFVALGLDDALLGRPAAEVFTITPASSPVDVATGPRIGISAATDLPWRFWLRGNRHVSRGAASA